jgi:hypothetical protein
VSFFLSPTVITDKTHTIVHSPFLVCKVATIVLQRTEHNNGMLFLKLTKQSKAGEFRYGGGASLHLPFGSCLSSQGLRRIPASPTWCGRPYSHQTSHAARFWGDSRAHPAGVINDHYRNPPGLLRQAGSSPAGGATGIAPREEGDGSWLAIPHGGGAEQLPVHLPNQNRNLRDAWTATGHTSIFRGENAPFHDPTA